MGERDSWCTPAWITEALPYVDLDPCSNPRSTVRSEHRCMLEEGTDGLKHPWTGLSVFCNGPFSFLDPWAIKSREARSWIFLVNIDPTTDWWRWLTMGRLVDALFFRDRVEYVPPPGVTPSKNDRASALLWTPNYRNHMISHFDGRGQFWMKEQL